jgi:hypothetical protein
MLCGKGVEVISVYAVLTPGELEGYEVAFFNPS